ncbi:MAG: acyltransferase [Chloroflexota bacterium]
MAIKIYRQYLKFIVKRLLNRPTLKTKDVKIGRGTVFGRNVRFNCKKVRIGDGVIFQDNVLVEADDFEIGDFGTVYFGCFFPGPGKIRIGHNFWLGNNSIIDSQGGTVIGNNVGIGAHSQLWTHMKFGDVVVGCRFDSVAPLNIGDDVWLVGHNLVSPVTIGDRSLAMLGSLIVKNIPNDRVVAGVPAVDQTDKFGPQFSECTLEKREENLRRIIEEFALNYGIHNVWNYVEVTKEPLSKGKEKKTIIDVATRNYGKTGTVFELILMRYLLPRAKYVPRINY